jgi:hypothetical protein
MYDQVKTWGFNEEFGYNFSLLFEKDAVVLYESGYF